MGVYGGAHSIGIQLRLLPVTLGLFSWLFPLLGFSGCSGLRLRWRKLVNSGSLTPPPAEEASSHGSFYHHGRKLQGPGSRFQHGVSMVGVWLFTRECWEAMRWGVRSARGVYLKRMTELGEPSRSVRPKKAGSRNRDLRVFLGGGWGCWESLGPSAISVHRKALEMSCAIQNQLARILAEFEMTLERDVLQPLSRLSEVTACPQPQLPQPPAVPAPPHQTPEPSLCTPSGGTACHPQAQEEPSEAGV